MTDAAPKKGAGEPDLVMLAQAAKDSSTDHMVEQVAILAEKLAGVADQMARPETLAAVGELLDKLTQIKQSGTLDHLVQTADYITAAQNALTDDAVENIASSAERLVSLADTALSSNIERALPILKELIDTGALEVLAQWAKLFAALSQSLTDSAIERIAAFVETTAGIFMKPETPILLEALITSAVMASEEIQSMKPKPTLRATLAVLADPDVQRMFLFFSVFAKHFTEKTKMTPSS